MIVQKSPEIAQQLRAATEHVEKLNKKELTNISSHEINEILPKLDACLDSLKQRDINPEPHVNANIEHWLQAWALFRKSHGTEKETQEKVAALAGLFTQLIAKGNQLEKNLKDFKIGKKVEGTSQSKHT